MMKNKAYINNSIYREKDTAPWTFKEPHNAIREIAERGLVDLGKVLEVGCGEGYHSIYLAEMGAHLTGIDLDENAIIYAQQNARERTVADSTVFIKRSFDQIDLFGCDQFDFVFDWRCLLEMTDPQLRKEYIHNVYRILRKGGRYLSVSFAGNDRNSDKAYLGFSPIGAKIYVPPLNIAKNEFLEEGFSIIETKHINVPQTDKESGELFYIQCNYLFFEK